MLTAAGDYVVIRIAGDDTIEAGTDSTTGELTLNGADKVDGGEGNDTIAVTSTSGGVMLGSSLRVKNVENLSIANAAGAVSADVSSWTGLQKVAVDQRSGDMVSITSSGNVADVTIAGGRQL